jgi:hypothetical protein
MTKLKYQELSLRVQNGLKEDQGYNFLQAHLIGKQ